MVLKAVVYIAAGIYFWSATLVLINPQVGLDFVLCYQPYTLYRYCGLCHGLLRLRLFHCLLGSCCSCLVVPLGTFCERFFLSSLPQLPFPKLVPIL